MQTPSPEIIKQLFEQVRARGLLVEIEAVGKGYHVRVSNDLAEASFRGPDLYDLALKIAFQYGVAARG